MTTKLDKQVIFESIKKLVIYCFMLQTATELDAGIVMPPAHFHDATCDHILSIAVGAHKEHGIQEQTSNIEEQITTDT